MVQASELEWFYTFIGDWKRVSGKVWRADAIWSFLIHILNQSAKSPGQTEATEKLLGTDLKPN